MDPANVEISIILTILQLGDTGKYLAARCHVTTGTRMCMPAPPAPFLLVTNSFPKAQVEGIKARGIFRLKGIPFVRILQMSSHTKSSPFEPPRPLSFMPRGNVHIVHSVHSGSAVF